MSLTRVGQLKDKPFLIIYKRDIYGSYLKILLGLCQFYNIEENKEYLSQ